MEGRGDNPVANLPVLEKLQNILRQAKWFKLICEKLERVTGLKRDYMLFGLAIIFVANLILGVGGQFICYAVGFIYPAFKTIQVIELQNHDEGIKWLMYWMVFSSYNFVELYFAWFILTLIPGYWLVKCLFLIWCFAPLKNNGSVLAYNTVIYRFFQKIERKAEEFNAVADEMLAKAAASPSGPGKYPNLRPRRKVAGSDE